MLGMEQLGISLQWRFRREPQGSEIEPMSGTIAIDLGRKLAPGVIDPHDSPHLSATDALSCKSDLVSEHPIFPNVWQSRLAITLSIPILIIVTLWYLRTLFNERRTRLKAIKQKPATTILPDGQHALHRKK